MAWKATGRPTVRKQRDKWVVRVDGIDTETGRPRPRQLGTYASQRSANAAARESRDVGPTVRGTVSWLVRRYVAGRNDITPKSKQQYEWAIPHIEAGLGAIPITRLDRDDVAHWIERLASGGRLSRRSVQICRNVLRAALADAVDEGLLPRSPAARVGLPRTVAKPTTPKEIEVWDGDEIDRFLAATAEHRLHVAFRLQVVLGLRRSEVLALKWDDLDEDARTLRIDESLVGLNNGAAWSNAKNRRSRRLIPLDDHTLATLLERREHQHTERRASTDWLDLDLIVSTRAGNIVEPRAYDRSLHLAERRAAVPPLPSHGLRHTAATHMVRHAEDVGELRSIADILGHSPEMLLNVYAHALPTSATTVINRINTRRTAGTRG